VRKAIDRALKQHGVKVDVVMEFDNVETIKQAIGIAAGVSILPRPTVVMESGMRTLATVRWRCPASPGPSGSFIVGQAPHSCRHPLHRNPPQSGESPSE